MGVKDLLRGFVTEGLVWPLRVVKADVGSDLRPGLLKVLEVVEPDALFLDGTDEPFNQAVLLWGVGGNEFLCKAISLEGGSEAFAGEHEAVVTAKHERCGDAPQAAETFNQSLFLRPPRWLTEND